MQMVFKPTNISKLTAELASNFTSATEKAGLELDIDCPDFSEPVYLDEEMWEKIVLNLLSNAFKFTFTGGISVRLRLLSETVELTISDTGIGISKEDQPKIFERFHRVSQARSRSYEGSGIGLALISELVKLHGGDIGVDSEPGKGTTFTIQIPRGTGRLPAEHILAEREEKLSTAVNPDIYLEEALRWFPAEVNEASLAMGKPRIILADDNSDMRDYIQKILSDYCQVIAVGNGRQALQLAKEIQPDLVLSDVMMPELDGVSMVELMRQDPALKKLPVILLTARTGEDSRLEGLQAGADDYLTKPFTRNELIARVNSNIHRSRIRAEIEESVRQSESRLRALVIATSDVIYRMNPDWTIMRQLDGRDFLQDTGAPLSEWKQKYIHPKDQERVWAEIQEAIRSKSVFQMEHQVIRADDTIGWTFSRAVPILDRQGDILEWFGQPPIYLSGNYTKPNWNAGSTSVPKS